MLQGSDRKEYKIDFRNLNLDAQRVIRLLDFTVEYPIAEIKLIVPKVLSNIAELADIRGGYVIFNDPSLCRKPCCLLIHGVSLSVGEKVFVPMRKSSMVAVYICSGGKEIGQWLQNVTKTGDLPHTRLAEILVTIVLETAMDLIQNDLKKTVSYRHLKITNRFSPGYCHWDIDDLNKVLSLIPGGFCNIRLNGNGFIPPANYVSGIIGIGKDVEYDAFKCEHCTTPRCLIRK